MLASRRSGAGQSRVHQERGRYAKLVEIVGLMILQDRLLRRLPQRFNHRIPLTFMTVKQLRMADAS